MMNRSDSRNREITYTLSQKIWMRGGIYAFIVIALLFIKATFSVFLLILAGALIALFFHGFSSLICRKTKWKPGVCLAVATLVTVIFLAGLLWLVSAKVLSQTEELSNTLPAAFENTKHRLSQSPLGKEIVDKISAPATVKKAQGVANAFFKTTFGVFGDIYVVIFIGIFFTVSPQVYKEGIVKLIPKGGQQKADDVLIKTGDNLKKWLKGKLFAMLVVFVLTAAGLVIIGMPLWLVLALIAGILNFIPNFGPLIALIPAVLIAFSQSPATALIVASLYIVVQVVESNFITPMVQQRLISIPPALIIIAQLLISPLTGGWGLVLATPLMVIAIVLIQELYLKGRDQKSA